LEDPFKTLRVKLENSKKVSVFKQMMKAAAFKKQH
jgi:hypothetical protein